MADMTYDKKLITICDSRGWDQAALWRAVGRVSKTTVSNWWNGASRPDMDTALVVARVLGVPLDYLADDNQDEIPKPLSQDEELALDLYRSAREHEGSATVVLKVLARLANEGVRVVSAPARAAVAPVYAGAHASPGRGGGVAVAEGDSGVGELPEPELPRSIRHPRVLAERDETEHHLRLERERAAKEREAVRKKARKPKTTKPT